MKPNFKSRLLRSTQKEIKKIKDASPVGRNINYPESIKDNILELLNDRFRSVDLLSKDLGLSKTFIYGIRKSGDFKKEKVIKNKPINNRKTSKKKNNNNDDTFDFLDISSSLKGNCRQESSVLNTSKNETDGRAILQDDHVPNDKIKPFMKVTSPSGFTFEIWG